MSFKVIKGGALFLDRDGVINRMVRYGDGWDSPQRVADVRLVRGILGLIRLANSRGIPVIVISNQPGVAKGKMEPRTALAIQDRVESLLAKSGCYLNKIYICKHHPDGVVKALRRNCSCRKPKPGLLLKAARELGIDLKRSVFVGDKETDAQAGKAAGCKTVLYTHDEDEQEKVARSILTRVADYKVRSLLEVVDTLEKIF